MPRPVKKLGKNLLGRKPTVTGTPRMDSPLEEIQVLETEAKAPMKKVRLLLCKESGSDHSKVQASNIPPGLRKRKEPTSLPMPLLMDNLGAWPKPKKKEDSGDTDDGSKGKGEDEDENEDEGLSDNKDGDMGVIQCQVMYMQCRRRMTILVRNIFNPIQIKSLTALAAKTFTYKIAGTDAFTSCVLARDMPFSKWRTKLLQALGIPTIENASLGWKFYNAPKTVLPDVLGIKQGHSTMLLKLYCLTELGIKDCLYLKTRIQGSTNKGKGKKKASDHQGVDGLYGVTPEISTNETTECRHTWKEYLSDLEEMHGCTIHGDICLKVDSPEGTHHWHFDIKNTRYWAWHLKNHPSDSTVNLMDPPLSTKSTILAIGDAKFHGAKELDRTVPSIPPYPTNPFPFNPAMGYSPYAAVQNTPPFISPPQFATSYQYQPVDQHLLSHEHEGSNRTISVTQSTPHSPQHRKSILPDASSDPAGPPPEAYLTISDWLQSLDANSKRVPDPVPFAQFSDALMAIGCSRLVDLSNMMMKHGLSYLVELKIRIGAFHVEKLTKWARQDARAVVATLDPGLNFKLVSTNAVSTSSHTMVF
ncbi:hypothetical protein BS47DRAFT_1367243 [Hydnum rufescens UP504]|uniref:Uncharacterized protein n=1 Tax=Hydnum rufescens UP504 TaxID=1448309 RepID=A0A9P6DPS9_9AGAM|nr:hypothetical protein BS47DRAFT_1367243 [Hydnum rufescens UP504]